MLPYKPPGAASVTRNHLDLMSLSDDNDDDDYDDDDGDGDLRRSRMLCHGGEDGEGGEGGEGGEEGGSLLDSLSDR